ncbi:RNA polymerase sigma factor [Thermomonospora amylolytica]|uniref:RNA polymerase sigma factor n=1 Tax=Thermomonospora amylolytica TaxID=1411117 RepID=UPI001F3F6D11|nr:RNA polymerase sigma factor [Thermomonospora amylolytica]
MPRTLMHKPVPDDVNRDEDGSVIGSHSAEVRNAVAVAHRREWGALLASTARVLRDLDLAEECVQEAYVSALDAWERHGVPDNPGAWLSTAARRNALDALRRAKTLKSKLHLLVEPEMESDAPQTGSTPGPLMYDDRLRLIFMCCHPALSREAQIALTMRLVCGVSTADIAKTFLVTMPTMAARITRAKKKIVGARIPFGVPEPDELPERLNSVLTVIHLLFTTGHTAPSGRTLTRADPAERALDLARMLHELMPGEREVKGLLALLLITHARRATRTDAQGRLLLLEEQDRSAWDRAAIEEGRRLLAEALEGGAAGRFTLQAAIASVHATAPAYADTDWGRVLVLYDELLKVWPSPVVALNRAVAMAMAAGPTAALSEVERLERTGELAGYHYLPAVKADLLRRLDRRPEAAAAYRQALDLADNEAERAFLASRLTETAGRG